jgi:hypothetical protein
MGLFCNYNKNKAEFKSEITNCKKCDKTQFKHIYKVVETKEKKYLTKNFWKVTTEKEVLMAETLDTVFNDYYRPDLGPGINNFYGKDIDYRHQKEIVEYDKNFKPLLYNTRINSQESNNILYSPRNNNNGFAFVFKIKDGNGLTISLAGPDIYSVELIENCDFEEVTLLSHHLEKIED